MSDPYAVLGLRRGASVDEVLRRYRELAKQHHPDLNQGSKEAEARFKAISEAYERIRKGETEPDPPPYARPRPPGPDDPAPWRRGRPYGASRVDDLFEAMRAHHMGRNRDVNTTHAITLEDAFLGKVVDLTLNLPSGPRNIRFHIPPGVDDKTVVHIPAGGEAVFPQFPAGDLRVTLQIVPHPVFVRDGAHLGLDLSVDVFDLMLGTEVAVSGIDGAALRVTVPPLTQPDSRMRLRGHGMPITGRETQNLPPDQRAYRGDLIVRIKARLPDRLTDQQREMISRIRTGENQTTS